MPNGFHGSKEEWDLAEAPLRALDPQLEAFARTHNISVRRNYHNSPERSLMWGAPIQRLIQIYRDDEQGPTWNVWLCASEDRDGVRYWKRAFLREGALIEDIQRAMPDILEEAFATVSSWSQAELEFATTLAV